MAELPGERAGVLEPVAGDRGRRLRISAVLATLNDADRATLTHILDGLLANTRIRAALGTAS